MPVATAIADPPLDPPGVRSGAEGFLAGPNAECSVEDPIANSSQFVLPTMTAPAALEALDNRRAVGRNVMLEDSGPRRRAQTPRADVVFYSDRNAEERQVVGPGRSAIERRRATESSLVVDGDERIERPIEAVDSIQRSAADLDC